MKTPLCEGEACSALTITWDAALQRHIVYNDSARRVRLVVDSRIGYTDVIIEPHDRHILLDPEFEYPCRAMYVE
jgi:hypothetical protein